MNHKITIYQLMPRLFGNKNQNCKFNGTIEENGSGKFEDITNKALAEIRDLGITHIWFTGIIRHGTMTNYEKYGIPAHYPALVKGRAGSPYAICDYYDVDPDLAVDVTKRMAEFDDLVKRTHDAGLKIIIDMVPNHVFRQYKSVAKPFTVADFGAYDETSNAFDPHNDFYYIPDEKLILPGDIPWFELIKDELHSKPYHEFPARATGNDQFTSHPGATDWYETVKLNYGIDFMNNRVRRFNPIPSTWKMMFDIVMNWAQKGVDGFRCDMAEMVPVEFWHWVIMKVKKEFPEMIFIAEIYNPLEYHNFVKTGGFDFLYDKVGLYDTLRNIICNNGSTRALSSCWQALEGLDAHMVRFIENHDEVRIASPQFAGNPLAAIPAMAVATCMNKGPVLIWSGQEVGEPANGASGFSGDDGRTTIFDYFNVPELQKWMNDGKFDGGDLSSEQHRLRQFYQKILHFSLKSEAISQGQFYDLMWVNNHDTLACRDKIYAWLRHSTNQKILFITNFDRQNEQRIRLRIPDHAFYEAGFNSSQKFTAEEIIWNRQKIEFTREEANSCGIEMTLKPWDVLIFELKAVPEL